MSPLHPLVLPWLVGTVVVWCAWTALVAAAVRWTCYRDVDRWFLTHLDEAARHEMWVRDEALRRAAEREAAKDAEISDLRASLAVFTRAAARVQAAS